MRQEEGHGIFDILAFLLGLDEYNPKQKDTPNRKMALLIIEFLKKREAKKI